MTVAKWKISKSAMYGELRNAMSAKPEALTKIKRKIKPRSTGFARGHHVVDGV